jgi:RNA polymerase sigma-70 factor (ECF subfamily)
MDQMATAAATAEPGPVVSTAPVVEAGAGSTARRDFEAFYLAYRPRATALAFALCGNRWAAEELAHDAFASAWQHWDKVAGYDSAEMWLRRALLHRVISRSRRAASEARALLRVAARRAAVVDPLASRDEEFWHRVRALPARQAQVIALFYLEDLSVEQVAEVLGVSSSAVKNALHSGRERLRATLSLDAVEQSADDETITDSRTSESDHD